MSQDRLRTAIDQSNLQNVRYEINQNVIDLTKPFNYYYTSYSYLSYAIEYGNYPIVKYLLETEAKFTIYSALPAAIKRGNVKILSLLLSKQGVDINKIYKSTNKTPLSQAIGLNNYDMVDYLLRMLGANPNTGETPSPLARAVLKPDIFMVKLLFECGAVIDPKEDLLKEAIQLKSLVKVDLLMRHGAPVKNSHYQLIQQLAKTDENFEFFLKNVKITKKEKPSNNNYKLYDVD